MATNPIIVLAMHRSGSSAVAGILHYLGVDMGAEYFLAPSPANPKGYFEDSRFVNANSMALRSVGGAWNCNVKPHEIVETRTEHKRRIRGLLRNRDGIWGWKDPRTVLAWPLYEPYLKGHKFVMVTRDNAKIAQSLRRRNKMPLKDGLRFASVYHGRMTDIVSASDAPVICVPYSSLVASPVHWINQLAAFTGCFGSVPMDFVDKSLRHF
jgi:hypothetical protein